MLIYFQNGIKNEFLKGYHRKAAIQNNSSFQFIIGTYYFNKNQFLTTLIDKAKAKYWIKLAAQNGHDDAEEFARIFRNTYI